MTPAEKAAAYLACAMRDLDRASERLSGVAGAEPETAATKKAADLVAEILRNVRRELLP